MKAITFGRRAAALLVAVLLAAVLMPAAFAAGKLDPAQESSLTLKYPCDGVKFDLYRVAEVDAYGSYTLAAEFSGYGVTLNQPDQSGWRGLAKALAAYVKRDELSPAASGLTDGTGALTFSKQMPGLYLVVGETVEKNDTQYVPESFLVALPNLDAGDRWVYDLTAEVKYEKNDVSRNETVTRTVTKVWAGDSADKRPESVTVQLLKDGEVYDTVTLNEDNEWSYQWDGLEASAYWEVAEASVPEGYTVTADQDGEAFTITNTAKQEPAKPEEPAASEIPVPVTPVNPTKPATPDPNTPGGTDPLGAKPEGETDPGKSGLMPPDADHPDGWVLGAKDKAAAAVNKLIQTGQLWWPVWVLAGGGVALLAVGIHLQKKNHRDDL